MSSAPLDRLRAIAWSSLLLAGSAAATILAWVWRAATAGSPADVRFAVWQRPFVDGPSPTALYLALAATVLLFMLPVATRFAQLRYFTTRMLAVIAAANVILGLGYLLASYTYDNGAARVWVRPTLVVIALDQLPMWAMAIVAGVLIATAPRYPGLHRVVSRPGQVTQTLSGKAT